MLAKLSISVGFGIHAALMCWGFGTVALIGTVTPSVAQETAQTNTEQPQSEQPEPAPVSPEMAAAMAAFGAGDLESARAQLEVLAADRSERGDGLAQFRLAFMLIEGRGGPVELERGFEELQIAVGLDNPEAMLLLGQLLLQGSRVERDPETAGKLLTRAAQLGNNAAQMQLAEMYVKGIGVPQNLESAAKLVERAMQGGNAQAAFELSRYYARGWGVEQDPQKAQDLLGAAAKAGVADAQFFLALQYQQSSATGAQKDADTASGIDWMMKAAQQGHAMAQRVLGTAYLQGSGVAKDSERALQWLSAAADAGEAGAQSNLGYIYATGQAGAVDFEQAAKWYERASDQGLLRATTAFASLIEQGKGVEKNLERASGLYLESALQGEQRAQARMAQLIVNAKAPLPPKERQAVNWIADLAGSDLTGADLALSWLEARALTPDGTAQGRLGHLFMVKGADDPVILAKGVALISKAAARGNAYGQYHLAQAFGSGDGVEQDFVQAHKWANLAAARGHADAKASREIFADLMTSGQIAQAQKLAREFVAQD